jgi:triacylglycerol esterase/lipase EstA (alpha/beta hydrolase family)
MSQEPNDPHSIGSLPSAAPHLDDAYRATSYLLFLPEYTVSLRIEEPASALDDWLAREGYKTWAFISAYNPRSQPLSKEENRIRHQQLIEHVESRHQPWREGMGRPDRSDWKPEYGLFLPGITKRDAMALARRFQQNALLFGTRGQPPQLIYTDLSNKDA